MVLVLVALRSLLCALAYPLSAIRSSLGRRVFWARAFVKITAAATLSGAKFNSYAPPGFDSKFWLPQTFDFDARSSSLPIPSYPFFPPQAAFSFARATCAQQLGIAFANNSIRFAWLRSKAHELSGAKTIPKGQLSRAATARRRQLRSPPTLTAIDRQSELTD